MNLLVWKSDHINKEAFRKAMLSHHAHRSITSSWREFKVAITLHRQ
jgi:hypothetical protein